MESPRPLIFDIKRHALEDGPGIRTTVFFKGCQLRCWWCQNPESNETESELGFYAADCIGCGDCVTACEQEAVSLDNPARIDRRRCNRCGDCAAICPGGGLRLIGKYYPVEELLDKLLRDRAFYQVSGGGVTLSGGEPTLHLAYVSLLLQALKKQGIHTAIQTNGFFDWAEFASKILNHLDLIMFDVKMANPSKHLKYTGQENGLTLENLARLLKARPEAVLPRIPLVPGITATDRNLREISYLLQGLHINRCSLLPYNPTGFSKANHIGKSVSPRLSTHMMSAAEEQQCRKIFSWAELVSF
jgi:pyruvate formate lyase activating enzyme